MPSRNNALGNGYIEPVSGKRFIGVIASCLVKEKDLVLFWSWGIAMVARASAV